MPWGRHQGGYPYPIMLCNITQNSMGQTPRGVPSQVQQAGGVTLPGQNGGGVTQIGYPSSQVRMGGTLPGGGGTLPEGGTQLGQQKEYSLHGGRYASCVHAVGLSCYSIDWWIQDFPEEVVPTPKMGCEPPKFLHHPISSH